MSYQSSIHFDPTALLIIKKEVDNSIKLVESAVSALVEDQSLPFGIDDALNQFEQCAQVLALIDMPSLAKIAQYSAELMRRIMAQPKAINTQEVIALSEGTTMLKRYIEFICLREVKIPQFLLDSLNRLEMVLGKPLTAEGQHLENFLDFITPDFNLPVPLSLEKSKYVHQLYKLSLNRLLQQQETEIDLQAIKLVGCYLAGLAQGLASQHYWSLVHFAFDQIDQLLINEPRLRSFIGIERNIATFIAHTAQFKANLTEFSNVLSLCISQDNDTSVHIRQQLNIGEDHLTDTQLQVFSRHLYGPDFDTIQTISELVTSEMAQLRNDIEFNYHNMTPEKTQQLQSKLIALANIFSVLNLTEAQQDLMRQSAALSQPELLQEADFAQQLMQVILSAMNSIGVLERHHTSSRLQLRVHNMNISLDRLDEAHDVLLSEAKKQINNASQALMQYQQDQNILALDHLAHQYREIGGALLFLNAEIGKNALFSAAEFIQKHVESNKPILPHQLEHALNILASADMLIDNLKNKQPVMQSMFEIALASSNELKAVA